MAVGPQSAEMPAGVGFGRREFARLVPLGIAPSETVADHLRVDEVAGAKNPPDFAAIAVGVGDFNAHALPEDFGSERVSRLGAEGLGFFGGIDAGEADLMLDVGRVEHGQGVPVGDLNDLADNRRARFRAARAGC